MRRFADTVAERLAADPEFRRAVEELDAEDAEPVCGSASGNAPSDLPKQTCEGTIQ